MFAVSPAWFPAHDAPGKQVTVVVELLGLGRTLANVATPAAPTAELLLHSVQAGSLGQVTNTLDPWSGVSQIGQVQIQVSNTSGFARTLGPTFRKSAVRLLLGIGALTMLGEFLPLFTGHVEQVEATGPVCTITLVPGAFAWHRDLSVLIGDYFFTGTDDTRSSQAIPLLVSRNVDVETIPLTAVVSGTLAQAVSSTDTALWIREFNARFSASGTVILGEDIETLTYSQRQIVDTQTGNLLVLSGLTRLSPVAHSVGTVVAVDLTTWQYLIGFQCTVLAVRRDGRVLPETAYTVEEIPVPGTIPATVLTFTQSQAGTVLTVDVDGSNIAPTVAPIVNGGFETGDTTGWTLSGATATVTTGDTPDFSQYKCALTGGYLSAGSLRQEFPVVAGRGYLLALWGARRPESIAPPLSNANFASGDLTGWTMSESLSHPELLTQLVFGAVNPQPYISSGVTYELTEASAQWAAFRAGTFTITGVLEQSCAVVAASVYRYSLTASVRWQVGTNTPETPPASRVWSRGTVSLDFIDPSSDTVLVSDGAVLPVTTTTLSGTVTPPQNTLLVRITLAGTGYQYPTPPVHLGGLLLNLAQSVSLPTCHIALGTPTVPTQYTQHDLPGALATWHPDLITFVPTAEAARLTVTTQYDRVDLPAATWLDAIRLEEEGRNPVDVLRWIIETFLPGLQINDASFQAAYLARAAWRCGGQWRDPGDSRALLTHLADQFELRYVENGAGEACLVPIATRLATQAAFQATFTATNARAVTPSGEPPTHLATDIYVYYNPRRGAGGHNPADYGAVVYATPETTTGELAWQFACAQVAQVHGIRQTLRYFAEAMQDQLTAHLKLAALVERYTTLGTLVQWTALSLRDAPLEIGDAVVVQHALLGDLPQVGEVLGVAVDLGTPALQITARITGALGAVNPWEYPLLTGDAGSVNTWETF